MFVQAYATALPAGVDALLARDSDVVVVVLDPAAVARTGGHLGAVNLLFQALARRDLRRPRPPRGGHPESGDRPSGRAEV